MSFKIRRVFLLQVLCPLFIGAFIYFCLSPEAIFVRILVPEMGRDFKECELVKELARSPVRIFLPDMLWSYALVWMLYLIMKTETTDTVFEKNKSVGLQEIFSIAFVFSAVMEILQLVPAITGTFDPVDILVEALAEILAVLNIKTFMRRHWI